MRPKKIVLLLDRNQERRLVRRFVLEQWYFRVLSGPRFPKKPGTRLADYLRRVDVIVLDGEGMRLSVEPGIIESLREECPEAKILTVGATGGDVWIPRCLLDEERRLGALVERIRTLAARKRGPKGELRTDAIAVGPEELPEAADSEGSGRPPGSQHQPVACV